MSLELERDQASRRTRFLAAIARITYGALALLTLVVVLWYVLYTASRSELWDFGVFYGSARAALSGQNIYQTYGQFRLPYWYFPWVAWMFIPFALLPLGTAKIVFILSSLGSAATVVFVAGEQLGVRTSLAPKFFMLAMSLLASWLLFRVGQADFLLVLAIVCIILLIDRDRMALAGAGLPLLLFKPHLLLVFIPFAVLRGGRRFVVAGFLTTLMLGLLAFAMMPRWPLDMIGMLRASGQRVDNSWGFTTLPELIGRQENWSGTANLPLTLALSGLALALMWGFRRLPTMPLLAGSLAASLFCAPRAYSYNVPLLLPALLLLTPANLGLASLLWFSIGAVSLLTQFSTGAYVITLFVFSLVVVKFARLKATLSKADVR